MADRYDDYDRERRREPRGRGSLLGGRDYEHDREGSGRIFSRPGSEHDERDWRRESWGSREERGYGQEGYGGGMGSSSQDWRTGRYGGGLGYGREEQRGDWGEPWGRDRDWRSGEDWDRGRGGYGRGAASESDWGHTFGGMTSYGPGRYTGRGPKGYRRSDERIMEEVCDRLARHPEIDASEMEVRVTNSEVVLTGSVEDRHQKRLAEDVTEDVSGVHDVRNDLKISRGIGERIGEALGLSGGREQDRRTTGQQSTTPPAGRTGPPQYR